MAHRYVQKLVWSEIQEFQILSKTSEPFLGLGFSIKIMTFNEMSQNLQRAVRPAGVSTPSVRGLHCGEIFE